MKSITLLWHGEEPIGICVMTSPAISLRQRNRFFGKSGRWSRVALKSLNNQLVTLSRVVLHPVYRGAGLAAAFIRQSCLSCPWPWIETLTQMGHINPFFEKAGFQRVGVTQPAKRSRRGHSALYGGSNRNGRKESLITQETNEKSRYATPVYYIFDNRRRGSEFGGQRSGEEE